ncbi:sensor histidine kinase [Cellulosilyticum sp. I15G10I2]|uniref:sensor histidine kinase n=1 Tax=Cellulosilyticum sp. I15G10I2 TaxID=1892843 RepID=UPI001A9A48B7|nr:sensor histidine kinase [Cellulosilyticum sp. I15G10I2]
MVEKTGNMMVQNLQQVADNLGNKNFTLENEIIQLSRVKLIQYILKNYHSLDTATLYEVKQDIHQFVAGQMSYLNQTSQITLYTRDYDYIVAYGGMNKKYEITKDELKKIIEGTKKNKQRTLFNITKDKGQLIISIEIKDTKTNMPIGYMLVRLDETYFSQMYRYLYLKEHETTFIIDQENTIISGGSQFGKRGERVKGVNLFQEIMDTGSEDDSSFITTIGDKKYLCSFAAIKNLDMYIVSLIPTVYLYQEAYAFWISTGIVYIITLVIAIIVAYLIAKSISSPLQQLTAAMNRVKSGTLLATHIDPYRDEIGMVVNNFNEMVMQLKQQLLAIQHTEKQKRKMELKALQAQINPHFLVNTLNSIKCLTAIQNTPNIEELISALINLVYQAMSKGDDMITIDQEIQLVKDYMTIQRYRYFDKFEIIYDLDEKALGYKLPRLLLQPIIENAIIHGLAPKDGVGLIKVKIRDEKEEIRITVIDNGVGISEEKISEVLKDSIKNKSKSAFTSIGIANIDSRIKLIYGEQYGVYISSTPHMYTSVEINIPKM